jgi:hypothetical protein
MNTNPTDQSPEDTPKKSSLNDMLENSDSKRTDGPAEEFISPDPQSVPERNENLVEQDQMGISEKAKNQTTDEGDVAKGKK